MPITHVPYVVARLPTNRFVEISYPSTLITPEYALPTRIPYWSTSHAHVTGHDPDPVFKSRVYQMTLVNEVQKGLFKYDERYKWYYYSGWYKFTAICADIDRDGGIEVIATSPTMCFDGKSGSLKWTYGHSAYTLTAHDINNDGLYEIIIPPTGSSILHILDCNGNAIGMLSTDPIIQGVPPVVFDVNNDGENEILIRDGIFYTCLKPNGYVLWRFTDIMWDPVNGYPSWSITASDIDNDGIVEVIITGMRYLHILDGRDGSVKASYDYGYPNVFFYCGDGLALRDINNDGNLEIITAVTAVVLINYNRTPFNCIVIFDHSGRRLLFFEGGYGYIGVDGVCVTDNVAVVQTTRGYIYACNYRNVNSSWYDYGFMWYNNWAPAISADIDGDGKYEIMMQGYTRYYAILSFYKEDGTLITRYRQDSQFSNSCAYDVDKDGIIEVVATTGYLVMCYY